MPVLLQNEDGPGYTLRSVGDDGETTIHDLRPEGGQILINVYGVPVGGPVDAETVEKLVGLRLAALRPPTPRPEPPPPPPTSPAARAQEPARTPIGADRGEPAAPATAGRGPRRTRGREVALQVLYQVEQNVGMPQAEIDRFVEGRLREPRLSRFAGALVAGVRDHRDDIDARITEVAENWRLDRMAAIDRNILRLGAFEMLFAPDVPAKVAINEALELAKRYSTAQSSRFVNGILDRLLADDAARKAAPPEAPAGPAPDAPAEGEPSPEPPPPIGPGPEG